MEEDNVPSTSAIHVTDDSKDKDQMNADEETHDRVDSVGSSITNITGTKTIRKNSLWHRMVNLTPPEPTLKEND